jgi:hypothetical protein
MNVNPGGTYSDHWVLTLHNPLGPCPVNTTYEAHNETDISPSFNVFTSGREVGEMDEWMEQKCRNMRDRQTDILSLTARRQTPTSGHKPHSPI